MTKKIKLPTSDTALLDKKVTLPYNGNEVAEKGFSFSFACFDRSHPLFNLGDNNSENVVSGKWFLDLLDCLKSVSNKTIPELRSSSYDLHPVDWSSANAGCPSDQEQCEYWQFRINKSKGRVIGILLCGCFYVVWLDPHHNLSNSDGYGGVSRFKPALSIYETQQQKIDEQSVLIDRLKAELEAANNLLSEK